MNWTISVAFGRELYLRFCTQSGNCTHCGKYIQMDLGKHIAFYHLELAQLWRCPVMWCIVWKGTAQDCIDHMQRTHKVPLSVKAANLAKYFPAWTVTREQWSDMLMPGISGVAIDTLLFSRVGSPLCHRYRLISRTGSHAAFIEESDSAVGRRLHRRLAQDLAARVVNLQAIRRVDIFDRRWVTGAWLDPDGRVASKELQVRLEGRSLVNAPRQRCLPYRR